MQINTPRDGQISIDDQKPFVESNDVTTSDSNVAAFTIEGPEGYVIGIEEGTPVAPEFRTSTGEKLDGSARVTIQKCDKQGNPIGSGIVFTELMSRFDYEKFRTDPDFFRKSDRDLMIDEREIVKVFVDLPEGANDFSAAQSQLTIGDETSDFGKAVEIVNHDNLSGQQSGAVKQASQANTGGN